MQLQSEEPDSKGGWQGTQISGSVRKRERKNGKAPERAFIFSCVEKSEN